jgi:YD repeat-containing protein
MPDGAIVNRALGALLIFLAASQFIKAGTASSSANQKSAESTAATPTRENPAKSDRESAGLRGPVADCNVEVTFTPQGPSSRDWRMYTNKYNRDGSIYQRGDTSGYESFTYDGQGRVLTAQDESGKFAAIYTYDVQRRLTGITGDPDRTTTFEYDAQGRKTRIVKSELKASSSSVNHIYGEFLSGIENHDLSGFPPDGGLVKTSFNERDQATESQVYDANGNLTSRMSFAYDAKGRVAEFSLVETKLEFLLSPETRTRLAADPAASEETRSELLYRISYVYDDENRIVRKDERDVLSEQETITRITYNDHGDEMEEISTSTSPSGSPETHVIRFSFQYDSFGNWIEKTVSSPATGDKPSMIWSVVRRTITYY